MIMNAVSMAVGVMMMLVCLALISKWVVARSMNIFSI